jgi:two-component system, LytTR family, response regulator
VMIHTVLADDEVLARQKLRQLLRDEPGIDVVGEGMTAAETIDLVRATKPQLLFLDIQMPGMDGFDIATELCSSKTVSTPHIIFTTAHDQYALRAFEIHAVDYLLKPFTRERLSSAVERARKEILLSDQQQPAGNSAIGHNGNRYTTRIVFKSRGRIVFLPVSDIRWISAEENYVRISTQTETHLLRETMARLEEKLDPDMFLRVHRSSIVNLQHVKEVRTEADGDYAVVLINGEKLTMSRSYRSRINEWLTHN